MWKELAEIAAKTNKQTKESDECDGNFSHHSDHILEKKKKTTRNRKGDIAHLVKESKAVRRQVSQKQNRL